MVFSEFHLASEVQEREIGGKKFKLGTSICKELQDKVVKVISKHMDDFLGHPRTCLG